MRTEALSDEDLFAAFPGVLIDRDNIAHYRGLLLGKLLINQCCACGYWIYPHRSLCPQCLSRELKPTEVRGEGKVLLLRGPSTSTCARSSAGRSTCAASPASSTTRRR